MLRTSSPPKRRSAILRPATLPDGGLTCKSVAGAVMASPSALSRNRRQAMLRHRRRLHVTAVRSSDDMWATLAPSRSVLGTVALNPCGRPPVLVASHDHRRRPAAARCCSTRRTTVFTSCEGPFSVYSMARECGRRGGTNWSPRVYREWRDVPPLQRDTAGGVARAWAATRPDSR